jgi:hypothetical protein
MKNLLCHTGRIFTLDELNDQAKATPETAPRELNELPKDRKEDDMPDGMLVQRATRSSSSESFLPFANSAKGDPNWGISSSSIACIQSPTK